MAAVEDPELQEGERVDDGELEGGPGNGDEPEPAAPATDEPPAVDDDDQDLDDEERNDDEPPPDEQQPAPRDRETEALMEERGKKLDKLGVYIAKKLVEIFGEEAADELELCELCTWTHTFGWRVPTTPPESVRDAVKVAIGLGTIDELKPYDAFQTCQTCNGLGNVKTGSQVTAHLFRTCPSCQGRGYSSTLPSDVDRPAPLTPIAAMPTVDGGPASEPDVDMFGTPRGHPDYGKLAQHREVPISHWQAGAAQTA